MKRLAIIDGKSVFYRGYYAMPNLSTRDGTPTGGVYGFAALSLELIKKLQPDYVCVAWDKPKTNIRKRREIYPDYKAGRKPAPPDFYAQIPLLHELLSAFGWPLYELDDYEADDIMGTLAKKAEHEGLETMLISSDLDMLQCLAPHTHMYALKKGFSNIELFNPESFADKYGIGVNQFLDLKALKGDSSDNIPGVPGIGEKGAVKLLESYATLDNIYEHIDEITGATQRKLIDGKESAYLSREVAQIMFDAPLELDLAAMDVRELDRVKLADMLKSLEFTSLLRNLPEFLRVTDAESAEKVAHETPALKLVEFDDAFKAQSLMAEAVLLQLHNSELYLSYDRETFAKPDVTSLETIAQNVEIVTHGGDALCHEFLRESMAMPKTLFDVRQGGFLLNPLKKSRTIAELTGYDGDDIGEILALLWQAYDAQKAAFMAAPKLETIAKTIDFPLIAILARMEFHGMKLDTKFLAAMNVELTRDIEAVQVAMYEMVGYEFNIASPAQLAQVLFTKLMLPTTGIKKGKTGYSTGQKELDKLRGQHPIIELIEKYRELTKLQNTYVEALPKLVDPHSYIHTTFNQDVAATGRLSSTDPNLQNIPIRTELGRKIREAFVPSEGNVFVSADYSQFELRLAAVLADDKDMIAGFNADIDIHTKTAADVRGIALGDVTKEMRRDAKVVNFGVLYGMGPHALAQNTGMSFMDAKNFIDEYFKVRASVRQYLDKTLIQAREQGFVETLDGRRRPTPDVKSSNFVVRAASERAAQNMPIQGTEADLMKKAMISVEAKLPDGAQQVLQIHDSILVECKQDQADEVAEILTTTMESIAPELPIKLKVDVHTGKNWGEV